MITLENKLFFAQIEEYLSTGVPVEMRVKGVSMLPLLRSDKDSVCLEAVTSEGLRKYDICLFRYNGIYVLHRLISVENESLVFQGDGVCASCEVVKPCDVVAVVTMLCRGKRGWVSVRSRVCGIYLSMWMALRPVRKYLLAIYRLFLK